MQVDLKKMMGCCDRIINRKFSHEATKIAPIIASDVSQSTVVVDSNKSDEDNDFSESKIVDSGKSDTDLGIPEKNMNSIVQLESPMESLDIHNEGTASPNNSVQLPDIEDDIILNVSFKFFTHEDNFLSDYGLKNAQEYLSLSTSYWDIFHILNVRVLWINGLRLCSLLGCVQIKECPPPGVSTSTFSCVQNNPLTYTSLSCDVAYLLNQKIIERTNPTPTTKITFILKQIADSVRIVYSLPALPLQDLISAARPISKCIMYNDTWWRYVSPIQVFMQCLIQFYCDTKGIWTANKILPTVCGDASLGVSAEETNCWRGFYARPFICVFLYEYAQVCHIFLHLYPWALIFLANSSVKHLVYGFILIPRLQNWYVLSVVEIVRLYDERVANMWYNSPWFDTAVQVSLRGSNDSTPVHRSSVGIGMIFWLTVGLFTTKQHGWKVESLQFQSSVQLPSLTRTDTRMFQRIDIFFVVQVWNSDLLLSSYLNLHLHIQKFQAFSGFSLWNTPSFDLGMLCFDLSVNARFALGIELGQYVGSESSITLGTMWVVRYDLWDPGVINIEFDREAYGVAVYSCKSTGDFYLRKFGPAMSENISDQPSAACSHFSGMVQLISDFADTNRINESSKVVLQIIAFFVGRHYSSDLVVVSIAKDISPDTDSWMLNNSNYLRMGSPKLNWCASPYCVGSYDSRPRSALLLNCKILSVTNTLKVEVPGIVMFRFCVISVESCFWDVCTMELLVHLPQFNSIHSAAKFLLIQISQLDAAILLKNFQKAGFELLNDDSSMLWICYMGRLAEMASGEASAVKFFELIKKLTSISLGQSSSAEKYTSFVCSWVNYASRQIVLQFNQSPALRHISFLLRLRAYIFTVFLRIIPDILLEDFIGTKLFILVFKECSSAAFGRGKLSIIGNFSHIVYGNRQVQVQHTPGTLGHDIWMIAWDLKMEPKQYVGQYCTWFSSYCRVVMYLLVSLTTSIIFGSVQYGILSHILAHMWVIAISVGSLLLPCCVALIPDCKGSSPTSVTLTADTHTLSSLYVGEDISVTLYLGQLLTVAVRLISTGRVWASTDVIAMVQARQ